MIPLLIRDLERSANVESATRLNAPYIVFTFLSTYSVAETCSSNPRRRIILGMAVNLTSESLSHNIDISLRSGCGPFE